MKIALIAHDKKKHEMINFCIKHKKVLRNHTLVATGTTGQRINEATQLEIKRLKSGPLGGDQEIGAMIANHEIDLIVFFRDPLTAQPHEPDVSALFRLADVYQIPLASNQVTANIIFKDLLREQNNKG